MYEENSVTVDALDIAIIGMAGRFPGARNTRQFLENLKNGVESISFFSNDELKDSGIAPESINAANYVKAKGVMEDTQYFDAPFFGYTPAEAKVMNPQIRATYQCVWEALEDAAVVPESYGGLIGIYTGAGSSFSWLSLCILSGANMELGGFITNQLGDRDYISSRVAYKLNLKGPTLSLHTACSTSLVAIHLACQAVLGGECEIALAGGASITIPLKSGYEYSEGMIYSQDGHLRAFDANASGIIDGNGVGIVVLKRLEYALEDKDQIYAVIKGSAINNDGSRKIGFTAPSVEAINDVAQAALKVADVKPASIRYIEAHATGTSVGDPIELEGLSKAFKADKKQYCGIGSVKTNIGHLDTAAGVASLIKTALSLKHKYLFPSLNFDKPNPRIDFQNSPFYVNTTLRPWENEDNQPLRAAVNGNGFGGTNAFFIMQEPPQVSEPIHSKRPKLLIFSAMSRAALDRATDRMVEYLKENKETSLQDAAYTLQIGRKAFPHRRMLVVDNVDEAIENLSPPLSSEVRTSLVKEIRRSIIFMFPGQGSQYVNMGKGLYQSESIFREQMDKCFAVLDPLLGIPLKEKIYPSQVTGNNAAALLQRTDITQPVLFALEYSLAKLLIHWGIQPNAMIGHSIGEYTAACLAGVFSLPDALKLVVTRGRLMQQMPGGDMLSVPLSQSKIRPFLTRHHLVSLAAVNGPERCVVSGSPDALEAFSKSLDQMDYECEYKKLHTSHAFHSRMMEPILVEFEAAVANTKRDNPKIPYISNVTGTWISNTQVHSPAYWAKQLRETVLFSHGIDEICRDPEIILIEVGAGTTLSTLVKQHPGRNKDQAVVNLIRHPRENISDNHCLTDNIGRLWLSGLTPDWRAVHETENRRTLPLPTYSFDRYKYWIEGDPYSVGSKLIAARKEYLGKLPDITDWFYVPAWEQSIPNSPVAVHRPEPLNWLVFIDDSNFGQRLVKKLQQNRQHIVTVIAGSQFNKTNDQCYTLNPSQEEDYDSLFASLREQNRIPTRILHLWNIQTQDSLGLSLEELDRSQDLGLYSLLNIARSIQRQVLGIDIQLTVFTDNMHQVTGAEMLSPQKATILGAVKIIPLEYLDITCRSVDIQVPQPKSPMEDRLVQILGNELLTNSPGNIVAFRGLHRWVSVMKPCPMEPVERISRFKDRGVYLITGGLGGIGLTLAEYLAVTYKARLILTARTPLPPRDQWQQVLESVDSHTEERTRKKIRKVMAMEKLGAEVFVSSADVADYEQMRDVITRAQDCFGTINGILHSAGMADFEGRIQKRSREMNERVMAPKIRGTLVLDRIFKDQPLDLFVFFSSLAVNAYQHQYGQVGYIAANEFLESFANYKAAQGSTFTTVINWTEWLEIGMGVEALARKEEEIPGDGNRDTNLLFALLPHEGLDAFLRIMANNVHRVSVSTQDLPLLIQYLDRQKEQTGEESGDSENVLAPKALHPRPDLNAEYAAPRNDIERKLVPIFQRLFGIDTIGIYDDFFDLGGDSLKAMKLTTHLRKEGITLTVDNIFLYPTIAKISQNLAEPQKPGTPTSTVSQESPGSPLEAESIIAELQKNDLLTPLLKENKLELSYQVSPIQRSFLEDPDDIARNIIFYTYQFKHSGEASQMVRALVKVIQKNSLLRSVAVKTGNGYRIDCFQFFDNIQVPQYDVSNYSPDAKENIQSLIYQELSKPFQILDHLLYRLVLLEWEPARFQLIFSFNHLIFDANSMLPLNKKLDDAFSTLQNPSVNPEITDKTLNYCDYAGFLNQLDYEELRFDKYLNITHYLSYVSKVTQESKVPFKHNFFQVDMSPLKDSFKDFYHEIFLLCFAATVGDLYQLDKVPLLLYAHGRDYKNGNYRNLIGSFQDNIPLLLPLDRINKFTQFLKEFQDYKDFVRNKDLNFVNFIIQKYRKGVDFLNLYSCPFKFNNIIGIYDQFVTENENQTKMQREVYFKSIQFQLTMSKDLHSDMVGIQFSQNLPFTFQQLKEKFLRTFSQTCAYFNSK
jgi:acyl transferase domain-containing protein/aryl carrier-like protein